MFNGLDGLVSDITALNTGVQIRALGLGFSFRFRSSFRFRFGVLGQRGAGSDFLLQPRHRGLISCNRVWVYVMAYKGVALRIIQARYEAPRNEAPTRSRSCITTGVASL